MGIRQISGLGGAIQRERKRKTEEELGWRKGGGGILRRRTKRTIGGTMAVSRIKSIMEERRRMYNKVRRSLKSNPQKLRIPSFLRRLKLRMD